MPLRAFIFLIAILKFCPIRHVFLVAKTKTTTYHHDAPPKICLPSILCMQIHINMIDDAACYRDDAQEVPLAKRCYCLMI